MPLPKSVIAAVAAAGLAGGAAGAVVLAPTISGAQDAPETTTPETTAPDATAPQPDDGEATPPEDCEGGPHGHRGVHLEAAAEAIGIEADALREALRDGQTLAEVAQANGVDPQAVIDALVADASARLDERVAEGDLTQEEADERKAELTERITTMVNEGGPVRGPGGPGHGPGMHLDAAAEAIGIEPDALRQALQDGQTLAEVAQANGVDPQAVIDALVAEATARLDEAVAEGRLTQEEADEKAAELTERITTAVNEGGPVGGPGPRHHGPRGPMGDEAPEDAPEVEGSAFSGSDPVAV